jgi:predicted nucleotidyltransferase
MYAKFLKEFNLKEGKDVIVTPFGSRVYGTAREDSDYDYIAVYAPGRYKFWPEQSPNIHKDDMTWESGNVTIHQWGYREFEDLLNQYSNIEALEVYFHPSSKLKNNIWYVRNLEALRTSISKTSSNSWVKAKKKIWQGDYLLGQKSLFHSLRVLEFGIQIAEWRTIIDFSAANKYWIEIQEIAQHHKDDWGVFYERFHLQHNRLSTEFRKLAPKK